MNAIENNEFSCAWREMAGSFTKPKAVLCVSAHWETRGVRVSNLPHPRTIHDFYGFPDELFAVHYPAPGSAALSARVLKILDNFSAEQDGGWGFDHGAWSVLRHMYPDADVPVVQLSLDSARPGAFHYHVGKALAPLREEGVLILGSGNIVHNLGLYDFHDATPHPWAIAFDARVRRLIEERRFEELANFHSLGENAEVAIPTPEHFLPLLYILATAVDEEAEFFCQKTISSLSMTSLAFGL
jgi:Uncharacterized conserved protein